MAGVVHGAVPEGERPEGRRSAATAVFVSYARSDRERIEPLVRHLERQGLDIFWDQHIPAGTSFHKYLEARLEAADRVAVAWTRESVGSEWVVDEAREASKRKILVPFRLDDVEPPLGFRSLQTIDLLDWSGKADDPSLVVLADALMGRGSDEHRAPLGTRSFAARLQRRVRRFWRARRNRLGTLAAALVLVALGAGVFATIQDDPPSANSATTVTGGGAPGGARQNRPVRLTLVTAVDMKVRTAPGTVSPVTEYLGPGVHVDIECIGLDADGDRWFRLATSGSAGGYIGVGNFAAWYKTVNGGAVSPSIIDAVPRCS
jgi:hypothetical protein